MGSELPAHAWFEWLYGGNPDGFIWVGGHANGFKGTLFDSVEKAADHAIALDRAGEGQEWGVYHRLTTVSGQSHGRGSAEDSISLPALMMDLDIAGPGHKALNYPKTFDDLDVLIRDAGLPEPTTWVNSGGGRYAVWRLAEPVDLRDPQARADAADRSRALQHAIIAQAKRRGLKVDNTSDLARVYRVPGSVNRKAGQLHVVTWNNSVGRRFAVTELTSLTSMTSAVVDLDRNSHDRESHAVPSSSPASSSLFGRGIAGLFDQKRERAPGETRDFTVTQAMAFVTPALDALATAADGEINVRLNDAACALAHFGPEFWDEAAADKQLENALSATAYDGRTWKAQDTIASARRAMAGSWRAVLTPGSVAGVTGVEVVSAAEPDAVDALLAEMLDPAEVIARPAPKFLIHGLLQLDSESWIIGPPGSKKSFVVLDMAARVARGEGWQGRRAHAADVVMIVAEGAGGVGKRLSAWEKRHGAIPAGRMRILPRPVQAGNPQAWGVLVAACARLAASAREQDRGFLVVLDTQARVTVGLKENDATDMGVFVGAVSALRQATQGCVLAVHHTGRTGGDARGSSAIDGAQTTELKVMPGKSKLAVTLSVEKQKDIEEIDNLRLGFEVIDLGQDEDGMPITSLTLADQESVAFKAAWSEAEAIGADGLPGQSEAKKETNPFTVRVVVDHWIRERTPAECEQWAVQVLCDVAEDEGLTGPEVRRAVAEKLERKSIPDATWYEAWQRITNTTKEEGAKRRWNDIVVSAGGRRWTVDRVVLQGLSSSH